jgi:hypothetical protein
LHGDSSTLAQTLNPASRRGPVWNGDREQEEEVLPARPVHGTAVGKYVMAVTGIMMMTSSSPA